MTALIILCAVAARPTRARAETLAFVVPPKERPTLAHMGVSANGLVERALRTGGWLCYATLVEAYLAARPGAYFLPRAAAERIKLVCGDDDGRVARPAALGTVLARQHNGLGNQMVGWWVVLD